MPFHKDSKVCGSPNIKFGKNVDVYSCKLRTKKYTVVDKSKYYQYISSYIPILRAK